MDDEKTFKTKMGFCHVLPDKIILTRDGVIGNVGDVTIGNNISKILIIYGGLSFVLFYFAFDNYINGQIFQSILLGFLGVYLAYVVINNINSSATPIIYRQKIKDVKFKKAIVGLTRSRFEVLFEDGQGKIKKRLIMLPGSLTNGQNESVKAIKILTDEKIILPIT